MEENGMDALREAFDALRSGQERADAAFRAFERQDLPRENAGLRETVAQLRAQLNESRNETAALRLQYEELSRDFRHELASKRLALLDLSDRQNRRYLAAGLERERARITELDAGLREAMSKIGADLSALDAGEREPLFKELADLRERLGEQTARARARREAAWSDAANRQAEALRELGDAPIEDAALKAVRRFFQWETFLGLKIISAVGALLVLLGAFTFGRFLYVRMTAGFQCAAIFALGLALLGAGEALHRKKRSGGFTLALTASGAGVLFLGAALGYMTLGVLPLGVAIGICAGASLLTFAASVRYNAQLVALIALIGGYLPVIERINGLDLFYSSISATIISLFALLLATRKNWQTTRFAGLFMGMTTELITINLLVAYVREPFFSGVLPAFGNYAYTALAINVCLGVIYIAFLIIPVFGAWFAKTRIRASDIVLLSCNIFLSFLLSLNLWQAYKSIFSWGNRGFAFFTAFFALSCAALAFVTERQKHAGVSESETGSLRALFFITSVAFSALIVLFAADRFWFSAGWLVEAAGLALYGIFKNRRRFRIAGTAIGALCLFAFLIVNIVDYRNPLFVWQYLLITLAAAVLALASLRLKPADRGAGVWLDILRFAAALNVWGFAVYVLLGKLKPVLLHSGAQAAIGSLPALLAVALAFAFAFVLPRVRRIYCLGFQAAAAAAGAAGTVWLLGFNAGARGLAGGGAAVSAAVFALYVAVNLVGIGWMNDLLRFAAGLKKLPLRWYPFLVSGFSVILASQNLVVQLSLKPESLILTLIFGLTALGWVVFGFRRRNGITRVTGLALAFFAVLKLFVLDLRGLSTVWRIVSYFTAGAVLLAISFVYQHFSKKMEKEDKV
ncbi:MAG: DUF2339 domain-containing protein [Firmicutes bacterium]|nr:DUF2339 domain-containing protein [Bacillota bacterium]